MPIPPNQFRAAIDMRIVLGIIIVVGVPMLAWRISSEVHRLRPQPTSAPATAAIPGAADRFVAVMPGETFPHFEVTPLADGAPLRFPSDGQPRFTIVNFHSPDCPCAANCALVLNDIARDGKGDVQIVSVLAGPTGREDFLDRTRTQVEEGMFAFPLYLDPGNALRKATGVLRTPTTWLIGPDGRILFAGAPENTLFPGTEKHRYLIREALEAARAGKPPEPAAFAPLGCPIED